MTQTYCTKADIESILGVAGVLAAADDDEDGNLSTKEAAYVTQAIERAAVEINSQIRHQYLLADVANNAWLKWANAQLAAYQLRTRRANPAELSVDDGLQDIRRMLNEIRWGRDQLPEQSPSFNHLPSVSIFRPELRKNPPIRVDAENSTGGTPQSGVKRNTAYDPGNF